MLEPTSVADHSFESLLDELIEGRPVKIAGSGEIFLLENIDSRALLEHYRRSPQLWDSAKRIEAAEIEALLAALKKTVTEAKPVSLGNIRRNPLYHVRKIEAHRFGGLHRHCIPGDGGDPDLLSVDISNHLTLIHGFNGSGKTSLLNAITWCLTGRAFRAQTLPAEIHKPMTLFVSSGSDADDESGAVEEMSSIRTLHWPPVAPVPTHEDLAILHDEPKVDTWVRLSLEDSVSGRVLQIKRSLCKSKKEIFTTNVEGLESLGLTPLAIEIATVMPGTLVHMRLGEASELGSALALLTGLQPFEEFGKRCQRLYQDRLQSKEMTSAGLAIDEQVQLFTVTSKTFSQMLLATPSATPKTLLGELGGTRDGMNCAELLQKIRTEIEAKRASLSDDVRLILGVEFDPANSEKLSRLIPDALTSISQAQIRELRGMAANQAIAQITLDEILVTEAAIRETVAEATEMAVKLAEPLRAARERLYALVAKWHEETHPDTPIVLCPVCATNLEQVALDPILNANVRDALEATKSAKDFLLKAAPEWIVGKRQEFIARLPSSLRTFADAKLPKTILDYYDLAFETEFGKIKELSGMLAPIAANARTVWRGARALLPEFEHIFKPTLPEIFPKKNGLQEVIENIALTIEFWKYRQKYSQDIQFAIRSVVFGAKVNVDNASDQPVHLQPARLQLERLKAFAEGVRPFALLLEQVGSLIKVETTYRKCVERKVLLERASAAIFPFLQFSKMVRDQVEGLLKEVEKQTEGWMKKIYRPHYSSVPTFAGVENAQGAILSLHSSIGSTLAPAQEVMNTSSLRAMLWAFLFALWERVKDRRGGLSCMLMDDPQSVFDSNNALTFASSIPELVAIGVRPIISSYDSTFLNRIAAASSIKKVSSLSRWDISPVSSSKPSASLIPSVEDIKVKRDTWRTDVDNKMLAVDFIDSVRVYIETSLWDLLCSDSVVHQKPGLSALRNRIASLRLVGDPFRQPAFGRLLECPHLKAESAYYAIINAAHHEGKRDLTPADAVEVDQHFESIRQLIQNCQSAYLIHVERLPRELEGGVTEIPDSPFRFEATGVALQMLGRVAAKSASRAVIAPADSPTEFSLESLGPIALYGVRSPTLGMACLPGQTVIVSLVQEARNGDLVICLYKDQVYARRLAIMDDDPSEILLESISVEPLAPKTFILPSARLRLLKIIGVFFDERKLNGRGDAVLVDDSPAYNRAVGLLQVVDDSAIPVALPKQSVFVKHCKLDQNSIANIEGSIVAVVDDQDEGYMKRVGGEIPGAPNVRLFEKVGFVGSSVCLKIGEESRREFTRIPHIQSIWEVCGVLYGTSGD